MTIERLLHPGLYIIVGAALLFAMLECGVITVNRRYRIGPSIEERSSHTVFTPTCGGIIWAVAAIVAACLFGDPHNWETWMFPSGVAILGTISIIDDVHPLPPVPRLLSQIIVMALSFKSLFYPEAIDIFLLVIFCGVGIINAINFLDGICGMLGMYGIVVSATLLYTLGQVGNPDMAWLTGVMIYVLVAQVVFTIFNLRDTIFAGDVGAITLGYIQVFVAILLVLTTLDGSYLIFFAVCIFDTGLTTLQRLFSGVSILKPHRMNIYQILTAERGLPHLVVSLAYALLQLLINALFFLIPAAQHWTYFLGVCTLLTITYFTIRFAGPSKQL